jgi:hypothetical protein
MTVDASSVSSVSALWRKVAQHTIEFWVPSLRIECDDGGNSKEAMRIPLDGLPPERTATLRHAGFVDAALLLLMLLLLLLGWYSSTETDSSPSGGASSSKDGNQVGAGVTIR